MGGTIPLTNGKASRRVEALLRGVRLRSLNKVFVRKAEEEEFFIAPDTVMRARWHRHWEHRRDSPQLQRCSASKPVIILSLGLGAVIWSVGQMNSLTDTEICDHCPITVISAFKEKSSQRSGCGSRPCQGIPNLALFLPTRRPTSSILQPPCLFIQGWSSATNTRIHLQPRSFPNLGSPGACFSSSTTAVLGGVTLSVVASGVKVEGTWFA